MKVLRASLSLQGPVEFGGVLYLFKVLSSYY